MHLVQIVLFLHVIGAIWASVGILGGLVVRGRLHPDLDTSALRLGIVLVDRLHRLYTLPGLIGTGLLGFSLVTSTGYTFTRFWIAAASLLFVILFHLALFGLSPRLSSLRVAANKIPEEGGNAELVTQLTRPGWRRCLDFEAILLIGIVLLMTAKP